MSMIYTLNCNLYSFTKTLHFPSKLIIIISHTNLIDFSHFSNKKINFSTIKTKPKTIIACSINTVQSQSSNVVEERSVSVILLAGGKGKRMGASMPKQYFPLVGKPIALHSFYTFSCMVEVKEIIVVCDPSYRDIFEDAKEKIQVDLKFALPGKERQDSVFSGLQEIDLTSKLVCIHDSARPLVTSEDVKLVLNDGWLNGAAVLGVPVKATIKEANNKSFVVKTLDRRTLWEMQTPQVIKPELLKKGFEIVNREGLEVTDDVSIVEHLKHPVYVSEGLTPTLRLQPPMICYLLREYCVQAPDGHPGKLICSQFQFQFQFRTFYLLLFLIVMISTLIPFLLCIRIWKSSPFLRGKNKSAYIN